MALKPWIANAVRPLALELAAQGKTRAAIGKAIKARAEQLGAKGLTRGDYDNPARRAITAVNAAKREGRNVRDTILSLPASRTKGARPAKDQQHYYRVIVTYENRDTGEKVNAAVTVINKTPLSLREAVDIAMNTTRLDRGAERNPSPWNRREKKKAGRRPEPIKGFVTAYWRE